MEDRCELKPKIIFDDAAVIVKNPEVTVREEAEEDGTYILFNAENELILVANSTGKFILDSCNEEKSVSRIIMDVKEAFTLENDLDINTVVKEYLAILHKAELIKISVEEK